MTNVNNPPVMCTLDGTEVTWTCCFLRLGLPLLHDGDAVVSHDNNISSFSLLNKKSPPKQILSALVCCDVSTEQY